MVLAAVVGIVIEPETAYFLGFQPQILNYCFFGECLEILNDVLVGASACFSDDVYLTNPLFEMRKSASLTCAR